MGLLDRLLRREPAHHHHLVPHWENPEEMGDADKASSFVCEGCGATFTYVEAHHSGLVL